MFSVIHNSGDIKRFETAQDVEDYIAKELGRYNYLEPREIYRGYGDDNKANDPSLSGRIKSVIVYQYKTFYTETFVVFEE